MMGKIENIIYRGNTLIYIEKNDKHGKPVIIKEPAEEHPSTQDISALENEFDITHRLNIKGVRKAIRKEEKRGFPVLVLEYIQGHTLQDYIHTESSGIDEKLNIAISLSRVLEQLHQQNITHNDLNSQNILVGYDDNSIFLVDFGGATISKKNARTISTSEFKKISLPYISPEQTGRINRPVDHRSDLYSLGIILYELFTGRLPFLSDDPQDLIHKHLAEGPSSPCALNPEIPSILGTIILKLLKKSADERYQFAFGLKSDLENCLTQLKKNGQIHKFPIAQYDHSIAFKIPEKLYGREKELRGLKEILDRVGHGSSELILIAGYAGTGKTVLVQELFRTMKGKGGIFIKGKAEQYRQGVPYTVISRAFHELATYVLSKPDREFQSWKESLSTTLGDLGKVLIDVVPDLELIIGKQKDVPQLRGQEAQNRFHYVFRKFLRCITSREPPLVLFIDDLQWIDAASLNVLKMLSTDEELFGLLIIGAYRDNEVGETHPLQVALREIERERVQVQKITLPNLKKSHIKTFVSEILDTSTGITELSSFLFRRTQGNPFFIKRFLLSLNEENHITYNTIEKGWSWDIEAIRALRVSDNVIDMLVANIRTLNPRTQDILKLTACIGDQFRRSFLSVISQQSEDIIDSSLEDALSRQYLYRDGEEYYFVHDRIQQAALALMDSDQQKETHLQIGRLLLKITNHSDLGDSVFEIVDHLNFCVVLLTEKKERKEVARLNLMAARMARERAAFDSMLTYVNQGIDILLPDCWEKEYELTLDLYQEAVEAEYLNGNFERVETRAEAVLHCGRTMLDKIKTYEILIMSCFAQNEMETSINTGMKALELLGAHLSKQAPKDMNIEECYLLPQMTDPQKLAVMRILKLLWAPVISVKQDLLPQIIFTLVDQCILYGNSPYSAFAYAAYSMFLCQDIKKIETGYQFGQLALKMMERFESREIRSTVMEIVSFTITWKTSFHTIVEKLRETVVSALETGNIQTAYTCRMSLCVLLTLVGEPLASVIEEQAGYMSFLRKRFKYDFHFKLASLYCQFTLNLIGDEGDARRLKGEYFDEDTILKKPEREHGFVLFYFYLAKTILHYLLCDYTEALRYAELAEQYRGSVHGFPIIMYHNFYCSLALTKFCGDAGGERKSEYLEEIKLNQRSMKVWAHHAPMNLQHKFDLVEAEKARALGKMEKALKLYEKAIIGARKNKFLHDEALSYEHAGECCMEYGLNELAQYYLRNAYYHYTRWGAKAKVRDLEERYPELFVIWRIPVKDMSSDDTFLVTQCSLDLESVIKASHALSSETDLKDLLNKMMGIVMENAGAERGVLLLNQRGEWFVQATGDFRNKKYEVLLNKRYFPGRTAAEDISMPESVLNLCIRSKKALVSNNALLDTRFTPDAYLQRSGVKSILCIPLVYQGKLNGVLYLENSLSPNVFDHIKVETLKLLCTQFSISLENALLYRSLDERLQFEKLLAEFSAAFVNLPSSEIDREIARWLKELVLFLGADRGTMYEFVEADSILCLSHFYVTRGSPRPSLTLKYKTWFMEKMLGSQMILFTIQSDFSKIPEEERKYFTEQGFTTYIAIPMFAGGSFFGIVDFASFRSAQSWSNELLHRLRLLEEIFANAVERKKNEEALQKRTEELKETSEKLRKLSAHLQEVREHERTSIAREIHDELGQVLTVMRMDASWIGKHLQDSPEKLRGRIGDMIDLIDATIRTVQRISTELRPEILDILGLFATIEWQAEEFQKREGIPCYVTWAGKEVANEKCATVLFRVFQEALTNITRHSHAREVNVHVRVDGKEAVMEISDDGRGITYEEIYSKNSLGLIGMRERVSSLNGKFEIFGNKNRGTQLRAVVPLEGRSQ